MAEECPDCGSGMECDPDTGGFVCAACDGEAYDEHGSDDKAWDDDNGAAYKPDEETASESEERDAQPQKREPKAGAGLPGWLRFPSVLYVAAAVVTIVYGVLYMGELFR